jgi:Tfp pilus assembly protein PilF
VFRKVLEQDPVNHEATFRLAEALLQQGRQGTEVQTLLKRCNDLKRIEEIQRQNPQDLLKAPDLMLEAGRLLLQLGRDKEGLDWLYRALEIDPNSRKVHQVLADYFEKIGQKENVARHQKFLQQPGP